MFNTSILIVPFTISNIAHYLVFLLFSGYRHITCDLLFT